MKTNTSTWINILSKHLPDSYKKWFEKEEKYLLKHITKDSSVLEIGCGNGRSISDILPITKNITGIDHNQEAIDEVKNNFSKYPNLNFLKADATNLPFDDKSFDFVICMVTFANLADKKFLILDEMKRVLKNSGHIIVSVFSENAYEERMRVYKVSGVDVKKIDGTTVFFDQPSGDNISEQFNKEQLENIFFKANLIIEDITKINIAYLCKLKKK